jgi:hypothetical protein
MHISDPKYILFEKTQIAQLLKNVSACYEIRISSPYLPKFSKTYLFPSNLRHGLASGLFPSGFRPICILIRATYLSSSS